jgi:bisphosphoglycerate-dependent phosphoglycerate mutase
MLNRRQDHAKQTSRKNQERLKLTSKRVIQFVGMDVGLNLQEGTRCLR